jgi:WD40 repeat protein
MSAMAVPSIETFLGQLEQSRLLSADELRVVRAEAGAAGPDLVVVEFARRLVDQGRLTWWQVEELNSGRTSFFFGKYKLLGELGRGGMGAVYKAVQVPLGRIVALKVMSPKLVSDEQAIARFHREIEAAAALSHPNVVTAFDADQVAGTHFLVMEYVEGESLAELLKREGRLPIATGCEYIRQAALGLTHAHERGMAHRDIKPANLLLTHTPDGQPLVKILDMGLARFTCDSREETELTSTGQVMGTPDYMAPEQARSTKSADIRSDIYSLGCTLFRELTGRVAFDGENALEKLMARAMGDAPSLREFVPDAPAGLESVLARMLARDPAARYQTPVEVALALEPFSLQTMPVAAPAGRARAFVQPVVGPTPRDAGVDRLLEQLAQEAEQDEPAETIGTSDGTRLNVAGDQPRNRGKLRAGVEERRRADRRRIIQALCGAVLLAVIMTVFGIWWTAGRTQLTVEWPAEERDGGRLEVDGQELAIPLRRVIRIPTSGGGRRRIHLERKGYEPIDMTIELARGETKVIEPRWRPTAATIHQEHLAELVSKVEAFRKRSKGGLPAKDDAAVQSLRRQFVEERPRFFRTPEQPRFEKLWRQLPFPADYSRWPIALHENLAVDPQSSSALPAELVAAWGDARLKAPMNLRSLSLSPDGALAVTWCHDQTVYVWNLQTGGLHLSPIAAYDCLGTPCFSPDGKFLAYLADDIVVWSLEKGRITQTIPLRNRGEAYALNWIPGSSLIAWSDNLPGVHLWDVEAREARADLVFPLDVPQHAVCCLTASRDGRLLGAGTNQGKVRVWELATREFFDLPGPVENVTYALAFSPDGSQLAGGVFVSVCLWDVATRQLRFAKEATLNTCINSLSWRPDGKQFAANTGTGDIALWNAAAGTVESQMPTGGVGNTLAAYSGDGRRLVTADGFGFIRIWDANSHEELLPTNSAFLAAAIDPIGEWVALGTTNQTIELRDLESGEIRETIPVPEIPRQLAVSPDRKLLGVAGATALRVISLDRQHEPRELKEVASASSITFAPDATLFAATAWLGQVAVWSTDDFQLKFQTAPDASGWPAAGAGAAVSPDSHTLLIAGGSSVKGAVAGFRLPGGKRLFQAPTLPTTNHVVFSAQPDRAVTESLVYLHLIDVASGQTRETTPVPGASGARVTVNSLNGSPDGEHLVVALSDGRLWFVSARNLQSEGEIDLGSRLVAPQQALYTPDGRHVVTVNANGTVFVLRLKGGWSAEQDRD